MPETISQSQIDKHQHGDCTWSGNPTVPGNQRRQDRLNSRLKERLEYSGIYFERDPQQFFSNLSSLEQRRLLAKLKLIYSQILFDYFSAEDNINHLIDRFAQEAFFINLPVNEVVEIHLELIDNLERQLILEGLHIENLSDFRLTLMDVIAHLGKMYRSANCNSI